LLSGGFDPGYLEKQAGDRNHDGDAESLHGADGAGCRETVAPAARGCEDSVNFGRTCDDRGSGRIARD
jgi:hypothetical protein